MNEKRKVLQEFNDWMDQFERDHPDQAARLRHGTRISFPADHIKKEAAE